MTTRSVFFVSDGTGITAETFGNAVLAQFEIKPRHIRLPFTDTVDKAHQAVRQINHTAEIEGRRPIVFTTLANMDVLEVIETGCKGMLLDMFGTFVRPLEIELAMKSNHRIGRFSDVSKSKEYNDRIAAIDFSLQHDDGQSNRDLQGADVILVDISMPEMSGMELLTELRTNYPQLKVIILTMADKEESLRMAFDHGAMAYLLKNVTFNELLFTIKHVIAGHKFICSELGIKMLAKSATKIDPEAISVRLTSREAEILQFISEGYTNQEIA
ncbi:MAG: response regulator, partial [Alphaproteobacteria bacterium]